MRRFLVFSVLFQWLVFLAAVFLDGLGLSEGGLLFGARETLTDPEGAALSDNVARSIVAVSVFATLTFVLWAMLLTLIDTAVDAAERRLAVAIAFGWTLSINAVALGLALLAGAYAITPMLAAAQVSTLLSVLATAAVELAFTGAHGVRRRPVADNDDMPSTAEMAVAGARVGRLVHSVRT